MILALKHKHPTHYLGHFEIVLATPPQNQGTKVSLGLFSQIGKRIFKRLMYGSKR